MVSERLTTTPPEASNSRRTALKALAAATGAVTLASLPSRWGKPMVQVGAIPAHAQASCVAILLDLEYAALTDWDAEWVGGGSPIVNSQGSTMASFYWPCGSGCVWFTITAFNPITITWTIFGNSLGSLLSGGNTLFFGINLDTQQVEIASNPFDLSNVGCVTN